MTEPTRPEPNRASGSPLRVPLLLAAAAAALCVAAGATRDFWAPDEPDFAQQTREMLERKDLLIPYQNGKPYSEKPPLFYWAIAATTPFSGGDVTPAATRVPSAVAAGFLVFSAAWLAGRRGGTKDALLAGAMTATAPLVFWQGQFLQIDALFAALVAAAFLAQYVVWNEPERARPAAWAFPLLLAAGILTKGPLVLVLCGLVALAECALRRSWKPLLDLRPFRGALLVVLLVVPWYVAASLSGGREYAYDLIVNQNWNRFFRPFDHVQPWWFYAEAIWGDFAPWTLAVLVGAVALARGGALGKRADLRFAATVLLTCFLFLSASGAKQGKYLLMAHPFAAVLLAASLARADASAASLRRFFRGYALVAGLLLAAGAVAAPLLVRSRFPAHAALVPYVAVPLGVGGLGAAAVALRRRSASPAFLALAAAMAAGEAAVAAAVFPAIDVAKTGRPFYERIAPQLAHGEPLAYYGWTYHCYPILVLRRRTEQFWTEDDLAAWIEKTPQARVLADASQVTRWTHPVLTRLVVVDRQPIGQDETFLMGLP